MGSAKILKPETIERLAHHQMRHRDLFEKLLDDDSDAMDEESSMREAIQQTISDFNLSPRHQHPGCKCTKIDCLKLYCECFAKGRMCGKNCVCVCCHNTPDNEE